MRKLTATTQMITGPQGPQGPQGTDAPTPLSLSAEPVTEGAIQITGTLFAENGAPYVFKNLNPEGLRGGKQAYFSADGTQSATWEYTSGGQWYLGDSDVSTGTRWKSLGENVATPDLVTLWYPVGTYTSGTPAISYPAATPATGLGQLAIVNDTDVHVCLRLSPVKWSGPIN